MARKKYTISCRYHTENSAETKFTIHIGQPTTLAQFKHKRQSRHIKSNHSQETDKHIYTC